MDDVPRLVIGTAGHIDHGKSRLVEAITGIDPDRLPEEKARGMTIDLGFAHTRADGCDLYFVDVPGHERFLRNMVAGATGVDVALLVVAADDSVMPQTREHAEVLRLLGVRDCVVALSKMDLVDDEWADAVELEVRELLDALDLHAVAIVRTSAVQRRGLDELRRVLVELARSRQAAGGGYRWFRLPIDRAFNVPGRGVVVTGSVAHGSLMRDAELELWPAGRRVRVRGLQTHAEATDAAAGRMRLAVNLAGVSLEDVARGCELATPGYLEPTRCLDVRIDFVRMPGKQLRRRVPLRLHIATSDVLAELHLLEPPVGPTVRDAWGQLRTERPIVASWGQRFILRDVAEQRTLGGGVIVRPVAARWNRRNPPDADALGRLAGDDPAARLEQVVRDVSLTPCTDAALAARSGLADAGEVSARLADLVRKQRVFALGTGASRVLLHRDELRRIGRTLAQRLKRTLEANPRLAGIPRNEWPSWMPRRCPQPLRTQLAELLIERGLAATSEGFVVPPGHAAALSPEDQKLLDALLSAVREGGFQPPAIESLPLVDAKNRKRVRELVTLALARGRLVRVADGFYLHADRWAELLEKLRAALERKPQGLTVAEIRDLLGSSRKYVVPLVEHLDRSQVTRRQGDLRIAGPALRRP